MIELLVINKEKEILMQEKAQKIDCIYSGEYREGDKIVIRKKDTDFLAVQLDELLAESIIYVPSSTVEFEIPFGDLKGGYDENAFSGNAHRIKVRESGDEAYALRNIALNSHDKRGQKRYFPHAYANLVTRDAVCFFEPELWNY